MVFEKIKEIFKGGISEEERENIQNELKQLKAEIAYLQKKRDRLIAEDVGRGIGDNWPQTRNVGIQIETLEKEKEELERKLGR